MYFLVLILSVLKPSYLHSSVLQVLSGSWHGKLHHRRTAACQMKAILSTTTQWKKTNFNNVLCCCSVGQRWKVKHVRHQCLRVILPILVLTMTDIAYVKWLGRYHVLPGKHCHYEWLAKVARNSGKCKRKQRWKISHDVAPQFDLRIGQISLTYITSWCIRPIGLI